MVVKLMSDLSPGIRNQIDELDLTHGRPLVLCDADEVLFRFVASLEVFLEKRGLWLDLTTFALTGNIKDRKTNTPTPAEEVSALIKDFHATAMHDMLPVPGAAEALAKVAKEAQIVVLTNIAAKDKHLRAEALSRHHMAYPVIANTGMKGPAAAGMADLTGGPVFFLDDIPPHHESVRAAVPHATLIHFIADERLAKLLPVAEHADFRIDTWPEAGSKILDVIATKGD